MPAKSKVKLLPSPLRDKINELLQAGVTLDAILLKLRELGVTDISRSSLGRYAVDVNKVSDKMQRSRQIADALVQKLGDAPESKTAQLNLELMHSAIFDLIAGGEDGEGIQLDAKSALFLAGALKDLAGARKTEADFVFRIRQETAKAVKEQAVATVEAGAKQAGLSAATVAQIKSQILGVKLPDNG